MNRDKACELLKDIQVIQEQKCKLEAEQLRLVARLNEVEERTRGVPAELALGLAVTENMAGKQIALADALVTRLPKTLQAMESGVIDGYKASKIFDATTVLSDEKAREVDTVMSDRLAGKNPSSLRRAVNRVVARIDPNGYAARTRRRRLDRKVELVHQGEGMTTLIVDLPVEVGTAIYARTDREAHALKVAGEPRTLDQLRADVLADRCLRERGTPRNPKADVYLYVDLTTLAGLNDNYAELTGSGPIPAWLAKEIAYNPGSTWRRVVTDPVTGLPVDVGRSSYRPPAALDRFIRIRDRECCHPGCHRPAQLADLDHTTDWAHGGPTDKTNLRGYCKRHHKLKDQPGWTYTDRTITTPAKATYTT
ncbi:HNH endonuclease [Amycolatopsis nigrescens]|uniref:HNH endonuclease n=1 Tax=Amycolatopsis nigrescens TaxID=381445 RepID=UPI0009FD4F45|nr:HNH endonuclease signature motif containing protein [Amycolatopsis nigrescens]